MQRNKNYVKLIVSTRPLNKHKRKTAQSVRDHEKIKKRLEYNGIMPDYISAYLEKSIGRHISSTSLLSLASDIEYEFNLKIDRLARRNRQALLCWFAENWNIILPAINKKINLSILSDKDQYSDSPKESDCASDPGTFNIKFDPSDLNQLLNFHYD